MFFSLSGAQQEDLLAAFWQALSNPIRLRVLDTLRTQGPLNVSQLVQQLEMGQGHLSNHLTCLKSCGLVRAEAHGRYVFYSLSDERVSILLDVSRAMLHDHLLGIASCHFVKPSDTQDADNVPHPG
ncbi:transcriptional regulator, ArsR family [Sulfobacillus thermosulfidooxidans DSM 9293]|uniref:Transcriptional regulator, ArsR family n=1 Tax=Sulfobacillus thermosulfidooxidans (strain DSM 9293 / VKM B-1269 / AT-1) TaxID=929705 RepID=A0A1W1W7J7_SULTA|nr:metalloregulator ArsR/SmtB family transcription factor [Sulfobacillus thermosulfidooxidans]SMC02256.1 transcriptional regulator, ArsR family [Sulfobacillus thermosulfidooxidans DSM 9293]